MAKKTLKSVKTPKRDFPRQKFVAYYRVSTLKQSLGLHAQKTMVKNYLKQFWPPAKSFTEKESGKSDKNRPELQKALAYCKKHKARLVVAKLDRLSRDLNFITLLQKNKIKFVACDMPEANELVINLMGSFAQYERRCISERTSRALQELKKKGKKLGAQNPKILKGLKKLWAKQRKLRKEAQKDIKQRVKKEKAIAKTKRQIFDEKVFNNIKLLRNEDHSFRVIAEKLNASGIATRQKGKWHTTSVQRVFHRNA